MPLKFPPFGERLRVTLPPKLIEILVIEPNGTSAPNTPWPKGEAEAGVVVAKLIIRRLKILPVRKVKLRFMPTV